MTSAVNFSAVVLSSSARIYSFFLPSLTGAKVDDDSESKSASYMGRSARLSIRKFLNWWLIYSKSLILLNIFIRSIRAPNSFLDRLART